MKVETYWLRPPGLTDETLPGKLIVLEGTDGQVLGIEVKMAAAIYDADVKHLLWLRHELPQDVVDLVVLTTGTQAYRRPDGIAVVPLALLGA